MDLVMACIAVESERSAFRIFETLNDRGLRLSAPDLLLNYLMREAKPESDRKQIRQFWTDMVERMAKRNIDRFLRHMWISKYGDLKSQDLFTALKDNIEKSNISSLEFARSCADECEFYSQLIKGDEDTTGKATKHLKSLLRDLNSQASLPLLLSAFPKLQPADFVKLCQWLLVFTTRYSVIVGLDASGLETIFFTLAREVREMLTEKPSAKPTDPKPNIQTCMTHIKDTLVKNSPSDEQIKLDVESLILSSDEAGYVLRQLACAMQTSTLETKIDDANIEHIFPKNPEENEWGGALNHEILEPHLWHIGNLTMLGRRINRKAENSEFSVKKLHYEKSELDMVKKIASDYNEWTEASIKNRAIQLKGTVIEVWNFDNSSRV